MLIIIEFIPSFVIFVRKFSFNVSKANSIEIFLNQFPKIPDNNSNYWTFWLKKLAKRKVGRVSVKKLRNASPRSYPCIRSILLLVRENFWAKWIWWWKIGQKDEIHWYHLEWIEKHEQGKWVFNRTLFRWKVVESRKVSSHVRILLRSYQCHWSWAISVGKLDDEVIK